jgi:hypothetical protein
VIEGAQYRGVDWGLGLGGVDIRKGWRIGKRWGERVSFECDWGFAYIYIYKDVRIDKVLVGVISNGQYRVDLSIRSPYTERRVLTHPSPINNQYRDGKIASPIVKYLSDVSDNTGLIVDFRLGPGVPAAHCIFICTLANVSSQGLSNINEVWADRLIV